MKKALLLISTILSVNIHSMCSRRIDGYLSDCVSSLSPKAKKDLYREDENVGPVIKRIKSRLQVKRRRVRSKKYMQSDAKVCGEAATSPVNVAPTATSAMPLSAQNHQSLFAIAGRSLALWPVFSRDAQGGFYFQGYIMNGCAPTGNIHPSQ